MTLADPALSRGDVMRRLTDLEDQVRGLQTARRLEAAAIGRGGIRVRGGAIVIQDADGVETMRLSTAGLTLTGLLQVLGEIQVTGNSIVVFDPDGSEVFRAGSDGLTLSGLLEVIGGGDIQVTDGRLIAADSAGDVFRIDPSVPEIFMRPELVEDLSMSIFAARIFSVNTGASGVIHDASSDYGDPTVAGSPGPTLADVQISAAGRALVTVGASVQLTSGQADAGHISFHVSGATVQNGLQLTEDRSARMQRIGTGISFTLFASVSQTSLVTDLNAGLHTFQAKYRVQNGTEVAMFHRHLTVIAF
jgi:hypothetical protein